jgi:hypothetical protein
VRPPGSGIAAWRFRTGVALMALGGVVYIAASLAESDALFAVAIALVGCGLLVHLSDPIAYRNPLTAFGLTLAAAGAFADAILTATNSSGAGGTIALAALGAGVGIAWMSRRI